jgi:cyclophilin family peptidyl-prolyl cis-trans isomerase/HEAT repeat protein
MSWILELEDRRVLRIAPPAPPPATPAPPSGAARPPSAARPLDTAAAPPPRTHDLVALLDDGEGRIRRRAALAIGRVGLVDGIPALVRRLSDSEPEVRQIAAFALGLIGDKRAQAPLVAALNDPVPIVKGAAAEALGLIGDASAAPAIAQMAAAFMDAGALNPLPDDTVDAARDTPASAVRLAMYALVRLNAYDALAGVMLDAGGQPKVRWWPLAYALQRLGDRRALPALLTLLQDTHLYTRAFAAKGLGAMAQPAAAAALRPLVSAPEEAVAIEAIRSLARLKDGGAAAAILAVVREPNAPPLRRLEAVTALGLIGAAGASVTATDALVDLLGDRNASIRAAAVRSLAELDGEGFMPILSGLDADSEWRVRASLASVLAILPRDLGLPRLRLMLSDEEPRVIPSVLAAIAKLHPQDAADIMLDRLTHADPVVRAAAAQAIGELKPPRGAAALVAAYDRGVADDSYVARTAALSALAAYGAADATPVLVRALGDKDWAVRRRAATLLASIDPGRDVAQQIRPVPVGTRTYDGRALVNPPVSTEAVIETDRGTFRVELAVLDAPLTVENFVTLARRGFFNGLPIHRVVPNFVIQGGDPRGDGEGGPGYTIRDELTQRPFLRGTVGMALDWADTGGSQFFVTHSPQPHLDARYTVFGRVLSGMDVVDRIEPWDRIRQVTIWDGTP